MPAVLDASSARLDARRASRFSIVAPVRFRGGGGEWLEGTTVNISRVGLLVRTTNEAPPPQTPVELHLALATPGTRRCARVVATGRVVSVAPSRVTGETLMAATIDEFQIVPAASTEGNLGESCVGETGNQQGDES